MRPDEPEVTALQRWILRHPIAAQAAFSGLAAEGRRFAATEAGARLREQLARSPAVQRARDVWAALTSGALVEDADVLIPSSVIEALALAFARGDVAAQEREEDQVGAR